MTFAREGFAYMIGTAVAAALLFGAALRYRSWPLWLTALTLTVVSLTVAWYFRVPVIERIPVA
jgi:uncharacterized membrane protein AbrB (regulator of aidB expression)